MSSPTSRKTRLVCIKNYFRPKLKTLRILIHKKPNILTKQKLKHAQNNGDIFLQSNDPRLDANDSRIQDEAYAKHGNA